MTDGAFFFDKVILMSGLSVPPSNLEGLLRDEIIALLQNGCLDELGPQCACHTVCFNQAWQVGSADNRPVHIVTGTGQAPCPVHCGDHQIKDQLLEVMTSADDHDLISADITFLFVGLLFMVCIQMAHLDDQINCLGTDLNLSLLIGTLVNLLVVY